MTIAVPWGNVGKPFETSLTGTRCFTLTGLDAGWDRDHAQVWRRVVAVELPNNGARSQERSGVEGRCPSKWAAAGKVVSKLTAPVSGDPVASLETRLPAKHGDSGSGRFLLQREVLFYKVVLGGSLISTCVRDHGCRPSEHQNVSCCLYYPIQVTHELAIYQPWDELSCSFICVAIFRLACCCHSLADAGDSEEMQ